MNPAIQVQIRDKTMFYFWILLNNLLIYRFKKWTLHYILSLVEGHGKYTGCFRKRILFCNLIAWTILVQIVSDFNCMCRNNLEFYLMFFWGFFPGIKMPFTEKEKVVLCVRVCLNTVKQDYAAWICERIC